jgi:hypothetical protein
MGKCADVFPQDPLGDQFGQCGAVHLQLVLFADTLVPSAKQKARVIYVVVEVVVAEKQVVYLGRPQARLDQFVGGGRPTVEHDKFAADLDDV